MYSKEGIEPGNSDQSNLERVTQAPTRTGKDVIESLEKNWREFVKILKSDKDPDQ